MFEFDFIHLKTKLMSNLQRIYKVMYKILDLDDDELILLKQRPF